jgi:O-antigen/teichoic acid export membrane protein
MNSLLKHIQQGRFLNQVAIIGSASAIAQALPVFASPFLLRMYSAHDYGIYSMLLASSAILLPILTLKMDAALAQARYTIQRASLFLLGSCFALGIAAFSAAAITLMHTTALLPTTLEQGSYWFLTVPLLALGNALQSMLIFISLRAKAFRDISITTIQKAVAMIVVQFIGGLMSWGVAGLVAGSLLASLAANSRLLRHCRPMLGTRMPSRSHLRASFRRFSAFAKYTTFSALLNALSLNIVVMAVGAMYNPGMAGQFSLAQRILAAPLKLISDAVGQVFLQRLTALKRNDIGGMKMLYRRVALGLALTGLIALTPVGIWLESIFVIVFGEDWRLAGIIGTILVPLVCIRFVVSPISIVNQFHNSNFLGMMMQFGILIGTTTALLLSYLYSFELVDTIRAFVAASCTIYVLFGLLSYLRLIYVGVKSG